MQPKPVTPVDSIEPDVLKKKFISPAFPLLLKTCQKTGLPIINGTGIIFNNYRVIKKYLFTIM
jgi:hypothetical protein